MEVEISKLKGEMNNIPKIQSTKLSEVEAETEVEALLYDSLEYTNLKIQKNDLAVSRDVRQRQMN